MNIQDEYARWSLNVRNDPVLKQELEQIREHETEINDRFYRDLEFGTGGLRGKIGAGTNRMNIYMIGKATQGLADYLRKNYVFPKVCIAYDTRNMSREFARYAAEVLCGNGITVFLFSDIRPTPMLSYTVRLKNASAGIVITASHNPREYNGYKIYNACGGQITDHDAAEIAACINACDVFTSVKSLPLSEALGAGLLKLIDEEADQHYFAEVKRLVLQENLIKNHAGTLKIIYSPLNGAGNIPVRRVLAELGFSNVTVVKEQEMPDGDFPTVPYPNPEEASVFRLAVEMARCIKPDLIIATDPDCDRIGVMAPNGTGEYIPLTGNQIGALLCYYITGARGELDKMPPQPAVIKTIVTSDIGKRICAKSNVTVSEVLTGFKYIGELAEQWAYNHENSFLFGYEESNGYLTGNFVRDKDGIIAAVLIAEMALYYKTLGMTLYEALLKLQEEFGYFIDKLTSVEMTGEDGQSRMHRLIEYLRRNYEAELADADLSVFEDYQQSVRVYSQDKRNEPITLPKSNVLKFIFSDGSWLVLRPSGTEPKIKIYMSAIGSSHSDAVNRLGELETLSCRIVAAAGY